MRQPPLEGIADEVMLVGARKGFHHQFAHAGNARQMRLQRQPVAHLIRQRVPGALVGEQFAHPFGEIGRERKLAAHIGRHFRVLVVGARDIDLVFRKRFVAHHLAAKDKGVADHQALDEIFLDLAEHPAAAPERAGRSRIPRAARAHQTHLQHRLLDDGADIEAIALPHPRIGDAPAAGLVLLDAREALVGFQRIAAGGDEIDHVVEIGPRQARIGRGGQHFVDRAHRRETARRRRSRARAAPARRARRCAAAGCPAHFRRPHRSRRAHSSTSKRLAGTSTAREASSMR